MDKTGTDRTEPPMDGAMLGIVKDLSEHGDRLAMLEKQASQDRKVIRGLLVVTGQMAPKAHEAITAMQDLLDQ